MKIYLTIKVNSLPWVVGNIAGIDAKLCASFYKAFGDGHRLLFALRQVCQEGSGATLKFNKSHTQKSRES